MKYFLLACTIFLLSPYALAANCERRWENTGIHVDACDNLSVVTLIGSPEERALAYGKYLKENGKTAVIDYFSEKVFQSVALPKPFQPFFHWGYNQWIRLWHRNSPKEFGEELNAFAKGLGQDPILLKRAISLPDTASALMGFENASTIPPLGCTSVAAEDSEGHFYYGRNLDFAGVQLWDRNPTILRIIPTFQGEYKHLVFGADGLLFGGITGVNEKGITVAIHQNYTKDAGVSGIPMLYIGEMILRSAENLDQAIEILKTNRPSVLWTFVITDLSLGQAVAVETSTKNFSVRWGQPEGFVQTNHLLGEKQNEVISLGTKLNSLQRMKTAFELLLKNAENVNENTIAKILSFQQNPDGYFSAYADILKAHTIQTVIFAPEFENLGKVYLSKDEAPTAGGTYLRFSLDQLFSDSPLGYEIADLAQTPSIKRNRQIQISQAFHAYFDEKNLEKSISILRSHPTLASLLFQTSAHFQSGQWQEAIAVAERALREGKYLAEPTYIRQSIRWIQLLSLFSLERFNEAKKLAVELEEEPPLNPRLRDLVKRINAGKRPNPKDFLLAFEFFSGDLGTRPQ